MVDAQIEGNRLYLCSNLTAGRDGHSIEPNNHIHGSNANGAKMLAAATTYLAT